MSQSRTEGGGYGAAHIDSHNMHFDRLVHNAEFHMPAMQFVQVKVSHAAVTYASTPGEMATWLKKKQGPARGESGAEVAAIAGHRENKQRAQGGGGRCAQLLSSGDIWGEC